jgi:putative salt-induced outer membrane protein YdiY
MMKKRIATLLLLALGYSQTSHAIVNMEDLHTGEPKEGFSGNVELSLSNTSGNTEKEDYALGSRLQWHQGKITDYLLLRGAYGESAGVKTTENSFLHARHIYQYRPRLAAEAYVQGEQDTFARLEFRGLVGAGGRFTLYQRESRGIVYLGLGAYYSQERIDDVYPDGGTDNLWRGSSYLILKYQATENTALVSSTYYQPAFEGAKDFRMLEQAAMKVKLNDTLSLVLSADFRYDSEPPVGVEKRDVTYTTAFSLEF